MLGEERVASNTPENEINPAGSGPPVLRNATSALTDQRRAGGVAAEENACGRTSRALDQRSVHADDIGKGFVDVVFGQEAIVDENHVAHDCQRQS